MPQAGSTIQRHFLLALAILIAAWLTGMPPGAWKVDPPGNYWPIRGTLILGTGFLAIACMSLAMILAARPVRLEAMLGGLDQFYRLHKRLGIAGGCRLGVSRSASPLPRPA